MRLVKIPKSSEVIQHKNSIVEFIKDSIFLSTYFKIWKGPIIFIVYVFFLEDFPNLFINPLETENVLLAVIFIAIILYIGFIVFKKMQKIWKSSIPRKTRNKKVVQYILMIFVLFAGFLSILRILEIQSIINFMDSFLEMHKSLGRVWIVPYSDFIVLKYILILLIWGVYFGSIVFVVTWFEIYSDKKQQNLSKIKRKLHLSIDSSTIPDETNINQAFNLRLFCFSSAQLKIKKIESTSEVIKIEEIKPKESNQRILKDKDAEFLLKIKPISSGEVYFSLKLSISFERVFYSLRRFLYFFPGSYILSKEFKLSIYPHQPEIKIISSYNSKNACGKRFSIFFEFENEGRGIARNIAIQQDLPKNIEIIDNLVSISQLLPREGKINRFITLISHIPNKYSLVFSISYYDSAGYMYILPEKLIFEINCIEAKTKIKPEPKIETVILASTPALKSTLYNDVEDKMMLEFDKYKLNPKLIYKTKYEDILKQIIHYKKKVEDSYWKITSRFKSEKVFQDDLYNINGYSYKNVHL